MEGHCSHHTLTGEGVYSVGRLELCGNRRVVDEGNRTCDYQGKGIVRAVLGSRNHTQRI